VLGRGFEEGSDHGRGGVGIEGVVDPTPPRPAVQPDPGAGYGASRTRSSLPPEKSLITSPWLKETRQL
jgi:hypothetical protein